MNFLSESLLALVASLIFYAILEVSS